PSERLFWGDLHCHTFFGDGLRCPEELCAFARDEAFLDIFALAEHSELLSDRQWEYFVGVMNDFNEPGWFVTLVGFEWTSHRWGHRNLYYPGAQGPLLRCNHPEQGQLECVYETAREHKALVIPHHSANVTMGVDWRLGHDPEVERLVEIHSVWGNSEQSKEAGNPYPIRTLGGERSGQHVIDALRMNRRFGFIGGGDIHDGRPGDELHHLQTLPEAYRLLSRQGIMAVFAPDLSREAIFRALWNRHCYATMNCRVYLEFEVCGKPMGSIFETHGERPMRVYAASEVPIARIEVIRNGEPWAHAEPNQLEVEFKIDDPRAEPAWYYARVTRADGLLTWSSPIWVD
ncbi:TPA: DUF3604 domain-containing protein, partial [Candidatus Poribacteria bacterium]|nr:DUF3604 domain-containing protein [Candidatus Poribacteria bacterium]